MTTTHAASAPRPGFLGALLALIDAAKRKAAAASRSAKAAAAAATTAGAQNRAALRKLAEMDPALLKDIGLTRHEVLRLARDAGLRL